MKPLPFSETLDFAQDGAIVARMMIAVIEHHLDDLIEFFQLYSQGA